MSIHLTLIHLNDVYHSFQTIVESEGLECLVLGDEEEGVQSLLILGFLSLLKSTSEISPFELVKMNFPDGLPFLKSPS